MLKIINLGKRIFVGDEYVGRPINWNNIQVMSVANNNDDNGCVIFRVTREGMRTSELILMSKEDAERIGNALIKASKSIEEVKKDA